MKPESGDPQMPDFTNLTDEQKEGMIQLWEVSRAMRHDPLENIPEIYKRGFAKEQESLKSFMSEFINVYSLEKLSAISEVSEAFWKIIMMDDTKVEKYEAAINALPEAEAELFRYRESARKTHKQMGKLLWTLDRETTIPYEESARLKAELDVISRAIGFPRAQKIEHLY